MKIVIRTDSSNHIGTGHVMRCLVLARMLKLNGHDIVFVSRSQLGDSIKYVESQGFVVYELPRASIDFIPKSNSDYTAWLQVPWKLDAEQFVSIIKHADLVITDHYALDANWQIDIRDKCECKILAIDDLVRKHDADIILDQTLMRTAIEYASSDTKVLAGVDYSLLNPLFSAKREYALEAKTLSTDFKVLVSMGGIDQDNITLQVLNTLNKELQNKPKVTVLLSSKAPNYDEVKYFCSQNIDWIEHLDFVENMADVMLTHDVSIGAPGTTSWERACLGLPSLIIPLAENQQTIAKNLVKRNAAILVEQTNIEQQLIPSFLTLINKWDEYRQANLKLCDGLGVNRVVNSINNLFLQNDNFFIDRATTEDIKQVYDWQCHPQTRKYALVSEVPSWDMHQNWMLKKLDSSQDFFYIIKSYQEYVPVGVVRLDRQKQSEYIVSIFVSPEYYGQGIAKWALNHIDIIHRNITIHATVLEKNIASQKLFTSAGYQRISADTFLRLPIT